MNEPAAEGDVVGVGGRQDAALHPVAVLGGRHEARQRLGIDFDELALDHVGAEALAGGEQVLQPAGLGFLVIVDEGDPVGLEGERFGEGAIARQRNAGLGLMDVADHVWAACRDRLGDGPGVGRPVVVDDEDVDFAVEGRFLREDQIETSPQHLRTSGSRRQWQPAYQPPAVPVGSVPEAGKAESQVPFDCTRE